MKQINPLHNIKEKIKQLSVFFNNHTLFFKHSLNVKQVSDMCGINIADVLKVLLKTNTKINAKTILTNDELIIFSKSFNITMQPIDDQFIYQQLIKANYFALDKHALTSRAPIVTIFGHVDHGKTTLLDVIRDTNVVKEEFSGITQHIGAYQITTAQHKLITFIDTPGHMAFSKMRMRGSVITDLAVLVIAIDDGIKSQTIESINHLQSANVPIIVFINKVDKPNTSSDYIKQQLVDYGLTCEAWGGQTITIEGSAIKKINIDLLLENIVLMSEILELTTNINKLATGVVLEGGFDKKLGFTNTLLVKDGTLKLRDVVVIEQTFGKIKLMVDANSRPVDKAIPSTPIKVLGLNKICSPGDKFYVVENEQIAKELLFLNITSPIVNELIATENHDIDYFFNLNKIEKLNIILKTDVFGIIEALKELINNLTTSEKAINIISAAAGSINDSDIELATSTNAIIYGFNTFINVNLKNHNVAIKQYNVIFDIIDDLLLLMNEDRRSKDRIIGTAKVQKVFILSNKEIVAGCILIDGEIKFNNWIKITRDDTIIFKGKIKSLRHEKNEVNIIKNQLEFGVQFHNFNNLQEGDICVSFILDK